MKKVILLSAAVFVCMAIFSQQQLTPDPKFKTVKAPDYQIQEKPLQSRPTHFSKSLNPTPPEKSEDFVTIINLAAGNNAFEYLFKGSFLWADDNLKTITHFHRFYEPGGGTQTGYGYEISVDAGLTWTPQNFCISGEPFAPRYLNHGIIYNPVGNTDPNEAYITFFGACLDQSNSPDSWGGYVFGRAKIGDPADTTVHYKPSHTGYYQYIPGGFCITQTGEVWVADLNQDWSTGTLIYQGSAIMNHGVWDEETMDFVYEEFLITCQTIDNSRPADQKVAFAPDGMTGYMAVLADNGEVPISAGRSYFPILWKTTDAGQTWEGPISVAIAGESGIEEVKDFLSDEELEELYGLPLPDRDTIPFTTAYDFDLHVDAWGNPHIAVVVGITGEDPYSFITGQSEISGYMFAAPFDLTVEYYTTEQWFAYELGRLKTFRGTFGEITCDNRIQIASSWDGIFMFITWNDTDLPGIFDNQQPDIWCRGIDVMNGYLTGNGSLPEPYNVTEFSEGMWQAYFHNLSHYVFLDYQGWLSYFTIPLTYQEMNPEDPAEPVQYKYISDFKIPVYDVGLDDTKLSENGEILVSGPMPNPASTITNININIFDSRTLEIIIHNLIGQKILVLPTKSYPPGTHPISIDVSAFEPSVYILTVTSEDNKVSKKLIVE